MITGNAKASILVLTTLRFAIRRPPGGDLVLEVARDALVSFGSQREIVEIAEPAAMMYPATLDLSKSFSILAASLNAENDRRPR
jgi:hypothetical protein